jgi:hypothetical protein
MIFDCGLSSELSKDLRRYVYQTEKIITAKEQHIPALESLSPDLQGRVVLEWFGRWILKVPYIETGSPSFVIEVARNLTMQMYNRGEVIIQPRSLCTVEKGVVWRKMLSLVNGAIWGIDMILASPLVRDEASAICLTLTELRFLGYKTFRMVLANHPVDEVRVRRYGVKLAVLRGVVAYSKRVRQSERDLGLFDAEN